MKQGMGQLKTLNPSYDKATKVFAQTMEFRSPNVKIDGGAISGILDHAAKVFQGSLHANDLTDYAWPPDQVDVEPHKDFLGATISFETRADKPKPIILYS